MSLEKAFPYGFVSKSWSGFLLCKYYFFLAEINTITILKFKKNPSFISFDDSYNIFHICEVLSPCWPYKGICNNYKFHFAL